ncbi:MAG: hypothetical protein AAGA35_01830 [Patescibacteria group bacterium]
MDWVARLHRVSKSKNPQRAKLLVITALTFIEDAHCDSDSDRKKLRGRAGIDRVGPWWEIMD